jgi:hypothetical protein
MNESQGPAAPAIIDRRATIAVLAHQAFGFAPGRTLEIIAREYWEPAGHRVLVHHGREAPPPADLAILHVPFTRVPAEYANATKRYARTINGAVTDISKRRIATDLLAESDAYEGPVIVKTDLNHGGAAERRMHRAERGLPGRVVSAIERRLPAHWFGRLRGNRYPIFASKRDVPSWVWRSPHLVVEPFHTERRGDLYVLHQWYFLGSHERVSTYLSPDPLVKEASVTERLPLHRDVPEAIRRRRAELKFDYGKFDYVISDGVPTLLDANPTPNEGPEERTNPRVLDLCAALAPGLSDFLP